MQKLLTVSETCEAIRMSATSVYRLIKRGELPALKIGESWRVPADELEKLIQGRYTERRQLAAN